MAGGEHSSTRHEDEQRESHVEPSGPAVRGLLYLSDRSTVPAGRPSHFRSRGRRPGQSLRPAFGSLQDRHLQEDGSYGSDAWRQGQREAIVSTIESMAAVVIEIGQVTVDGLRNGSGDRGFVRGGGGAA
jgi:hypothetical protein